MKSKIVCFIASLFLCISCNQKDIYRKIDDNFKANRWEQKEVKSYEFTVADDTKAYNMEFLFSHVYDYQFDQVPIHFEIVDPSGKKDEFTLNLKIKDAQGKQLAECGGDFCDLKHLIKEKVVLQKGLYKVMVSQRFQGPYLPNVLGIGIKVSTAN